MKIAIEISNNDGQLSQVVSALNAESNVKVLTSGNILNRDQATKLHKITDQLQQLFKEVNVQPVSQTLDCDKSVKSSEAFGCSKCLTKSEVADMIDQEISKTLNTLSDITVKSLAPLEIVTKVRKSDHDN